MKKSLILVASTLALGLSFTAQAENKPVGITPDLMSVTIMHNGQPVEVMRNQDNNNTVLPAYSRTSRPCPPFCIQPMTLAPGVETLGEIEVLDYAAKMSGGDSSILLVDSRTPDWVAKGTIPGAINIPWTDLVPAKGATTEGITNIMKKQFNVVAAEDADVFAIDEALANNTVSEVFDYSNCKTLVLFCNGMWCGQSPASIQTLLKYGYPAERIKWYRGGMQTWEILGLSTAKP
ncbi:MAG: rhodanese-like domain-containing protein [Gammaproteobacteria bacterium]|nr:rhodanese-like domain-containing protein [Gammaproteobacteria bacterium]MYD75675.1 rhodanese-like domain-containing protein [Gammaproteobacteria bacterium]MYJ51728.1 rhodanese-like domain-containing protein [Gammaproteobacteria bacterium]